MSFSVTALSRKGLVAFGRDTADDALLTAAELEQQGMSRVTVNDLEDGERYTLSDFDRRFQNESGTRDGA